MLSKNGPKNHKIVGNHNFVRKNASIFTTQLKDVIMGRDSAGPVHDSSRTQVSRSDRYSIEATKYYKLILD